MPVRTPNQEKALKWYCQVKDLKPQLSTHPIYYFTTAGGGVLKVNILNIVADWEKMRKESKQ